MANPVNVSFEGQAQLDFGIYKNNSISGVGLVTYGFLWNVYAIWGPCCDSVTTTWDSCEPSVSTTWDSCD